MNYFDMCRLINRKPSPRNLNILRCLMNEMHADKDYKPYDNQQIERFLYNRDAKKLLD
jgi:hypothetical protein